MRRSEPRRDWQDARAKCDEEGGCRLCGAWPVESAHVIGRTRDFYVVIDPDDYYYPEPYKMHATTFEVHPWRIVPLCRAHHEQFDAGGLDLLAHLRLDEQLQAVQDAGGIESARRRLAPSQYVRSGVRSPREADAA